MIKINISHKEDITQLLEQAFEAGYFNNNYSELYSVINIIFAERYYFRIEEIKLTIKEMIDIAAEEAKTSYLGLMKGSVQSIVKRNIEFIVISSSMSSSRSANILRREPNTTAIPYIPLEITTTMIGRTRTLSGTWTSEITTNNNMTSMSYEEELTQSLAREINNEIDREIINNLRQMVENNN